MTVKERINQALKQLRMTRDEAKAILNGRGITTVNPHNLEEALSILRSFAASQHVRKLMSTHKPPTPMTYPCPVPDCEGEKILRGKLWYCSTGGYAHYFQMRAAAHLKLRQDLQVPWDVDLQDLLMEKVYRKAGIDIDLNT